jgi:hypothetical protein
VLRRPETRPFDRRPKPDRAATGRFDGRITSRRLTKEPVGFRLARPLASIPMPVDHMELLAWIAERENTFPGTSLDGMTLMQQASGFAGSDGLPWDAVARAAGRLRKLGFIAWDYTLWPNETREPVRI